MATVSTITYSISSHEHFLDSDNLVHQSRQSAGCLAFQMLTDFTILLGLSYDAETPDELPSITNYLPRKLQFS